MRPRKAGAPAKVGRVLAVRSGTPASVEAGKVAVLWGCCFAACTGNFPRETVGDAGLKQSMLNFSRPQRGRGRKTMQIPMVAVNTRAASAPKCWC